MPNGSVYPWVSAQCRLTYFNYGLRVCCTPWRIHGLGLTGEPKLSGGVGGGIIFGRACWWGAVPGVPGHGFLPEQMPQDGGGAGSRVPPDMLDPDPGAGAAALRLPARGRGAALLPGVMSAGTSNITRSLGCLWTAVMWCWLFVTVDSGEIKAGSRRLKKLCVLLRSPESFDPLL